MSLNDSSHSSPSRPSGFPPPADLLSFPVLPVVSSPDRFSTETKPQDPPAIKKLAIADLPCEVYVLHTKGSTVYRRTDNDYVNATKLMNLANLTRGRRDGVLKNELTKDVG